MTVPQVQVTARDHLVSKGIPFNGAVAGASVLYRESGLNPKGQGVQSTEHGGVRNPFGAYGIVSWNGSRQQDYTDYCDNPNHQGVTGDKHLQYDNLFNQLDFFLTEMANAYLLSWAAIRSAASYVTIIPIIVDEYENPKNKRAEIDAALVIAKTLSEVPLSTPPSVPAPVPIPPQLPLPPLPAPPTPSQPPATHVPTSGTARRAESDQELQFYLSYLESKKVAELASLEAEFAAEIAAIRALISTTPSPSVATQAASTQGTDMLSTITANWKTSLSGLIAAAAQGIGAKYPEYTGITNWVTTAALAALGLTAQDAAKS